MRIKALTQIASRFGVVAVTVLFITAASGCVNFLPDKTWNEEQSVFISSSDFYKCVDNSVVKVPGVTVSPQRLLVRPSVELNVNFSRAIPGIHAHVEYVRNDTAIIYIGRLGAYQPDWVVEEVKPVVRSIAEAIDLECGRHGQR
jgi:hypothetical protein